MRRERRTSPRALTLASAASSLLLLTGTSVAHADLFGGDIPILTSIFQTGLKQLDQLRSVTDSLGKTYREVQRVARYAQDAKDAFRDFQQVNATRVLNSGVRAAYGAFPEAAYVTTDLQNGSRSWTRGWGQLGPDVEACVNSVVRARATGSGRTPECDELRRSTTAERVRTALDATYGSVPSGRKDLAVVRSAHVASEQNRIVGQLKAELVSHDVSDLLSRCKSASDPVVCNRIAAEATIKGYEQQADTSRKLDELLYQQAIANEARIAEARRAISEERSRRGALLSALPATGSDPGVH